MEVLEEALRLVEPSIEERRKVDAVANLAMNLVREASKEFNEIREILFGGSYAKDTWVSNDVDIDIFVKVDNKTSNDRFEYIGKKIGLLALRDYSPYLKYAQHPYVEAVIDNIKINVVPCYDVKIGEWKSAADRTVYHTLFINERFDEEKRREVRLLKRFMKVIGVYGAEIAVNGFSGYVCEVLILKYNTFIDLLKSASKFKEREVISIYDYDKSITFDTPLIILDPIDLKRNLGAAISASSIAKFILASRRFLAEPSIRFFNELKVMPNRDLNNVIVIKFNYKDRSDDIIWGEAKRSLRAVSNQLRVNNFKVIRDKCYIDTNEKSVAFGFLLDELELSKYYIKEGPKIFDEKHINKFLNANRDAEMLWIKDDRVMALKKRKYYRADEFIKALLTDDIERCGISKGLIEDIREGFSIHKGYTRERLISNLVDEIIGTDELLYI